MLDPNKPLKLLIIHGPNLNLLGERELNIYGTLNLKQLNNEIRQFSRLNHVKCRFFQSNYEGAIIDFIHKNRKWADGIVITPGALTHSSYALRDAVAAVDLPAVEVHLSDIHQRESFRKKSVIKEVCIDQISGLGKKSYFEGIARLLKKNGNNKP